MPGDLLVGNGTSVKGAWIQTQGRLQRVLLRHAVRIVNVRVIEADDAARRTGARVGRRVRCRVGWGVGGLHDQGIGVGVGSRCTLIAVPAVRHHTIGVGSQMTLLFLWTVVAVLFVYPVIALFDVVASMYCPRVRLIGLMFAL